MAGKKGVRSSLSRVLPARCGQDFVRTLDGRSVLGRAVRTRLQNLIDDLGGNLSYQQQSLCRRVIFLEFALESEEVRLVEGEGTDTHLQAALVSSLVSIYRLLGIKRAAPPQPTLSAYLAARSEASEEPSEQAKNQRRWD